MLLPVREEKSDGRNETIGSRDDAERAEDYHPRPAAALWERIVGSGSGRGQWLDGFHSRMYLRRLPWSNWSQLWKLMGSQRHHVPSHCGKTRPEFDWLVCREVFGLAGDEIIYTCTFWQRVGFYLKASIVGKESSPVGEDALVGGLGAIKSFLSSR